MEYLIKLCVNISSKYQLLVQQNVYLTHICKTYASVTNIVIQPTVDHSASAQPRYLLPDDM